MNVSELIKNKKVTSYLDSVINEQYYKDVISNVYSTHSFHFPNSSDFYEFIGLLGEYNYHINYLYKANYLSLFNKHTFLFISKKQKIFYFIYFFDIISSKINIHLNEVVIDIFNHYNLDLSTIFNKDDIVFIKKNLNNKNIVPLIELLSIELEFKNKTLNNSLKKNIYKEYNTLFQTPLHQWNSYFFNLYKKITFKSISIEMEIDSFAINKFNENILIDVKTTSKLLFSKNYLYQLLLYNLFFDTKLDKIGVYFSCFDELVLFDISNLLHKNILKNKLFKALGV